jgi:hypothetical protein
MSDPREYTNKLLQKVEEDLLDRDDVILMCLNWLSEADVREMCSSCDVSFDEEE